MNNFSLSFQNGIKVCFVHSLFQLSDLSVCFMYLVKFLLHKYLMHVVAVLNLACCPQWGYSLECVGVADLFNLDAVFVICGKEQSLMLNPTSVI